MKIDSAGVTLPLSRPLTETHTISATLRMLEPRVSQQKWPSSSLLIHHSSGGDACTVEAMFVVSVTLLKSPFFSPIIFSSGSMLGPVSLAPSGESSWNIASRSDATVVSFTVTVKGHCPLSSEPSPWRKVALVAVSRL